MAGAGVVTIERPLQDAEESARRPGRRDARWTVAGGDASGYTVPPERGDTAGRMCAGFSGHGSPRE